MKKKTLKKAIKRLTTERDELKEATVRADRENIKLFVSNDTLRDTITKLTRENIDLKNVLKAKEIMEQNERKATPV